MAYNTAATGQPSPGNLSILTKVDKLRELIGTKVALPQLVVVGDQSSGKSSVLEGLTGFGFPRNAELCTRYATQITCRRETEESINVSIIPHVDAFGFEQDRVRRFHRTLKEMSPEILAELFREANDAMGIRSSTKCTSPEGHSLPAFSEHILKIEKLGPEEEHFTVIDVPGIFRKETEGVTTEADIDLVRNMVKNYMKDSRTIILAIMPSNVDPATQEILKLARKADPSMTRTMAVLTKPDLAIENTMKQIAIDHVLGKRGDLSLGYYIVKNRGSDDADKTLEQGQADERKFFSTDPWTALRNTGRAGIAALRGRVRDLLVDLIKKEFPSLKSEVVKELSTLRSQLGKMGQSRDNQYTQRAYLNGMSESFQTLARDALNADYTANKIFDNHDLRLITRVTEASEKYSEAIRTNGHTRPFASIQDSILLNVLPPLEASDPDSNFEVPDCPDLDNIFDPLDTIMPDVSGEANIMDYIERVYRDSRGQELGTFHSSTLSMMFKEQSKKWRPITLGYMSHVIWSVHHFITEVINEVCPDERVRTELWEGLILEELQKSYKEAMDNAKELIELELDGVLMTLNHYFNDNLQKAQSERLVLGMEKLGMQKEVDITDDEDKVVGKEEGIFLTSALLNNTSFNMTNTTHVLEYMHDILKSYYKVARKRFVDFVYLQAMSRYLLRGKHSPLNIFNSQMVLNLNEDQLDMIAAEDAPVKLHREKLGRDIKNFEDALKVLRGSS
ncbi:P-loop containing nucleoside triphosphate hydrolase protein [Jackrogersella minutella]|nr:P-loop containing nucleoside triphosphate hydrolase protein [Jackrogersella minutella]